SSPSSATSRPSTAWTATISKAASATASMPSSPPPATTSACSCDGSQNFCVPSSGPSPKLSRLKTSLEQVPRRFFTDDDIARTTGLAVVCDILPGYPDRIVLLHLAHNRLCEPKEISRSTPR